MLLTIKETKELIEARNHVRETVLALEVCFLCERVIECEQGTFDNAAAWLCRDCAAGVAYSGSLQLANRIRQSLLDLERSGAVIRRQGPEKGDK